MRTLSVSATVRIAGNGQTRLETKRHCGNQRLQLKFDVGDVADHTYAIAQATCNASSGNSGGKMGAYTEFQEGGRASFTNHGRFNVTMDNGYTYEGAGNPGKKTYPGVPLSSAP